MAVTDQVVAIDMDAPSTIRSLRKARSVDMVLHARAVLSRMKIRLPRNPKSVATEDLPVVKGDQLKPKRR